MTGFESGTSGVGSDHSTKCTTTTSHLEGVTIHAIVNSDSDFCPFGYAALPQSSWHNFMTLKLIRNAELKCPITSQSIIQAQLSWLKNVYFQGGSPGLVVMGRDSSSKGCGFESQYRILDIHFSHTFVVKIVKMFV